MSIDKTLAARGANYGDFTDNADYAQHIKQILRDGRTWPRMHSYEQEALDFIASKIGRLLSGDPHHIDSWHDIIGYVVLVEKRLTAVKAPGQAIGTPAATAAPQDCPPGWEPCPGGYKSTNGPSLILKLESEDPDTIGELEHGSVRSHQEGCDAQGSRQEAGSAHHSV